MENQKTKQRFMLESHIILRYLVKDDDKIDTMVMCKKPDVELMAADFSVYEALASLKPNDNVKLNKLAKFFEVVDVVSYKYANKKEKPIMKHERVEELRKLALVDGGN